MRRLVLLPILIAFAVPSTAQARSVSPKLAREALIASYKVEVHIYGCHERRRWTDCVVSMPLEQSSEGVIIEASWAWTERVELVGHHFRFREVFPPYVPPTPTPGGPILSGVSGP
jgi:hypothetical protein